MKYMMNKKMHFSRMLAILMVVCLLAVHLPITAMATAEQTETVLKVGAGMADITPTQDMYPLSWGSGGRGYAFIGAAERIHVRVIALQNDDGPVSLMIGVDTGKGPFAPDMMKAIADETGVAEENIFWSTTHTHSTPENKAETWADSLNIEIRTSTAAEMYADICARNNSRWAKLVQKQLVVAAREAIDDLQEAEVGMAAGESNINVNRDTVFTANPTTTAEGYNGAGPSDKTLTTLAFRNKDTGEPIAFVIHYAMHNVLLYANDHFNPAYEGINYTKYDGPEIGTGSYDHDIVDDIVPGAEAELNVAYCDTYSYVEYELDEATGVLLTSGVNEGKYSGIVVGNAAVHPDIGGQVSQYVEYNNPGAVALWMSGAAGDQNPVLRNCMNYPAPYDMDVGDLKHFAAGSAVELTMKGGLLEAATYYAAIQYVDVKNTLKSITEYKSDMPISRAYGETTLLRDADQPPAADNIATSYSICLTVFCLGDITFAGSNGELYNNIGVRMREESIAPNVLVVNHCWPMERIKDDTYYADDVAIENNSYRWGNNAKYAVGTIYPAMIDLLNETYEAALAISP